MGNKCVPGHSRCKERGTRVLGSHQAALPRPPPALAPVGGWAEGCVWRAPSLKHVPKSVRRSGWKPGDASRGERRLGPARRNSNIPPPPGPPRGRPQLQNSHGTRGRAVRGWERPSSRSRRLGAPPPASLPTPPSPSAPTWGRQQREAAKQQQRQRDPARRGGALHGAAGGGADKGAGAAGGQRGLRAPAEPPQPTQGPGRAVQLSRPGGGRGGGGARGRPLPLPLDRSPPGTSGPPPSWRPPAPPQQRAGPGPGREQGPSNCSLWGVAKGGAFGA